MLDYWIGVKHINSRDFIFLFRSYSHSTKNMEYLNLQIQLKTFLFNLLTVSTPGSGSIKDRTRLSLVPKYLSQSLKPLWGMLMGLGLRGQSLECRLSRGRGSFFLPLPLYTISHDLPVRRGPCWLPHLGRLCPHVRFEMSWELLAFSHGRSCAIYISEILKMHSLEEAFTAIEIQWPLAWMTLEVPCTSDCAGWSLGLQTVLLRSFPELGPVQKERGEKLSCLLLKAWGRKRTVRWVHWGQDILAFEWSCVSAVQGVSPELHSSQADC